MSEANYSLTDLLTLMSRLREPEYGCPWDLAQSYETIVASTLEEAYEVVDAIEQGDYAQLKDELGDLLFQIVFYSQLGKEDKRFTFDEVVTNITEKLLRRHPHVFPDGSLSSRVDLNADVKQEDIKANWEAIKSNERQQKGHKSLMDDVPVALPAMTRAVKLQKRAASANFDWPDVNGVYDKIQEEIVELQSATEESSGEAMEEELGDLLFTLVNLSRHLKIEPETALRKANHKFEARFRHLESLAQQHSEPLTKQSTDTLEAWWLQAKQALDQ